MCTSRSGITTIFWCRSEAYCSSVYSPLMVRERCYPLQTKKYQRRRMSFKYWNWYWASFPIVKCTFWTNLTKNYRNLMEDNGVKGVKKKKSWENFSASIPTKLVQIPWSFQIQSIFSRLSRISWFLTSYWLIRSIHHRSDQVKAVLQNQCPWLAVPDGIPRFVLPKSYGRVTKPGHDVREYHHCCLENGRWE